MLKQSLNILKHLGSVGKSQDATDLLHEDLVMVEQRVEPAKKAAQLLYKKLQCCLQSQQGLDLERRMKKLPLMLLSITMAESFKDFDGDSSFRKVLEMCCFIEQNLAQLLADFEIKLEKEVLEPLNKLSEEELPEILKNKKQFAKLTTDWQNARNRSQASTGPQARQDGLKEELDEAWRKLENIKDQYSADLYHFNTKEDDYANYFIRLLELQAEYHKCSHEFLEHTITELKEDHSRKEPQMSMSKGKVFGEPLLYHLSVSGREIAVPIQECVDMLLHSAMREEGLFRLTAAASVVKRLKSNLDRGIVDHTEFNTEPHAVAGALKSYLRELPEPLMISDLYNDWFEAAGEKELNQKLEQLRLVLKKLPPENYNNLRYLIQFLSLLSEQQAVNKMTPSNIAIVLGPNLLWPRAEGEIDLLDMASASSVQVVMVIEPLIQYSSSLFSEGVDFEVPDLSENPDTSPSIPQPLESRKDMVFRTTSSSSTASSSSSCHIPLNKSYSLTSQDMPFIIKSSGSVGRKTSTWESPTSEIPGPTPSSPPLIENTSPVLTPTQVFDPSPVCSPTWFPKSFQLSSGSAVPGPDPVLVIKPTQKQGSEPGQLEPISELPPGSPKALLKIASPFKPRRSFIQNKPPIHGKEHVVVSFSANSKPRAPLPPKTQTPTSPAPQKAPPPSQPHPPLKPQGLLLKKAPLKKPGIRPPSVPPPLPPLVDSQQ
ncbi:SH3 domain-binding protein 1 isoform X1 [Osmerus mordax]|uniref:SH3 domain-binding protein 1 isoform X1 n=1 Tax=Osmerus mordax TaxID=8014 RepID=UPI00350F36A9